MTREKIKSRGGESSRSARAKSAFEEVTDRLAGLLPPDALQDALSGLAPEEITGPGGLMTELAGAGARDGAGRGADRASGLSAGSGTAWRRGQHAQRLDPEAGAHRARDGADQDAPGPPGQLRATAGRQAPDAAGRPG